MTLDLSINIHAQLLEHFHLPSEFLLALGRGASSQLRKTKRQEKVDIIQTHPALIVFQFHQRRADLIGAITTVVAMHAGGVRSVTSMIRQGHVLGATAPLKNPYKQVN